MTSPDSASLGLHPAPQRLRPSGPPVTACALDRVSVAIDAQAVPQPQGYRLTVGAAGVTLVGHDDAGVFYGRQTLGQLATTGSETVPGVVIDDWPDLLTRGYMLDISRDRVPEMDTIKQLIDRLARLKLNQLQIYTEHTIAFAGHESVWRDASPLKFEELAELEAYCRERFIDMVPCQNLFGHMHRWLTKPDYAHLAESADGWDTPWGFRDPLPFSLCPIDPASFELSADLVDQLAPRSGSELFNIGCDETLDVGQGRSRERCEQVGRPAVYLEYLQRLCARVHAHGKTPMFWGDIVLHHPELVEQVPQDAVLLNWGYEADHPFMEQSKRFQDAGVRFYVCPGTSSWCTLTGRGQNAIDNLRIAAQAANRHGAEGYLITDWGDHGHWQPFALSWVGLTYGAGVAWALEQNREIGSLPKAVSRVAAGEPTGELGAILWDLANVYRRAEPTFVNQTWWFRHLRSPDDSFEVEPWNMLTQADVRNVLAGLDEVAAALDRYRPSSPEADRLKREIDWCVRISRWACHRVSAVLPAPESPESPSGSAADPAAFEALLAEFCSLWLERCRPGGLSDSVEKLGKARQND